MRDRRDLVSPPPGDQERAALVDQVVAVELAVISWIRYRYMDTPFMSAAFQVMVGGALVFIAGILIGNS